MSGATPEAVDPRIDVLRRLEPAVVESVLALLADATEADGVRPLSEHALLHLRHGGDSDVRHLLLHVDGPDGAPLLAGYLHLDVTDVVEGSSAELAVLPAQRGHGLGRLLVLRAREESPDGRVRLWAHGDHPAARALAESLGFTRMRTLWQMRRSLHAALPDAELPAGVRVRAFVPGADDEAWVALNARAFADHAEQGTWTLDDLHRRVAEPWFDTAGFFVAVRDDGDAGSERMVGFHWTKVHGGLVVHEHSGEGAHVRPGTHGHEPLGEIYVLGVDPSEAGRGLGRALSVIGLRHLRAAGLPAAMLYVEADNAPAVRLYTGLGFTHWDTDVMFRSARR